MRKTLIFGLFMFGVVSVFAAIPQLISYQGLLTDDVTGDPVPDGYYDITFRIYDSESGGTALWTEAHVGISQVFVEDGLYKVMLGSLVPLDLPFDETYWLGVQVGIDPEMSPRYLLGASPYALRAAVADSMHGGGNYITSDAPDIMTATTSGNLLTVDNPGNGRAIYAKTGSTTDYIAAIKGEATGVTGAVQALAGWIQSTADEACGVYGVATSSTGAADGVVGQTLNSDGYGGYFMGGKGLYASDIVCPGQAAVGTTNPLARLHVEEDATADPLRVRVAGLTKFIVKNDGNVGVGVLSPQNKLDVEGAMVVGTSFSGTSVAPSSGLLVQGNVGLGTDDPGLHKLYVESSGSGTSGTTIYAENTNSSGIAAHFLNESSDVTLLVTNKSDGDVFRCDSWHSGSWEWVFKVDKDGKAICNVLQILGGSDLSEQFDIEDSDVIEPGMVLIIDPENPGKLRISDTAYDRRVAGIVSGAGDIETGMLMGQKGSVADGSYPVALTGRAYVLADASNSPIEPGDLLTTSDIPGYAMKATDYEKAHGAVIGKAMTPLTGGKGLVLTLITLQ
ncbi:hypothetical protein DRQ36_01190 [bacterium]|nr:MAG: hypothetical protein DRQ36_01190 [bacterium]